MTQSSVVDVFTLGMESNLSIFSNIWRHIYSKRFFVKSTGPIYYVCIKHSSSALTSKVTMSKMENDISNIRLLYRDLLLLSIQLVKLEFSNTTFQVI